MKREHPAAPASGAVYVEFREQISQAGERDDVAGAAALVVAAAVDAGAGAEGRQVGDLPDAPGAEVQKPPERPQVADLPDVLHVPLHVGPEVVAERLGRVEALVVYRGWQPE